MTTAPATANEKTSSDKEAGFLGGYVTQAEYELHRFDKKPVLEESRLRSVDTRRRRQPTWPS